MAMATECSVFDEFVVAPNYRGNSLQTALASLEKTLTKDIFNLTKRYFVPDFPITLENQGHMSEYEVESHIRNLSQPKNGNFFCFLGLPLREIKKKHANTPVETDLLLINPQKGVVVIEVKSVDRQQTSQCRSATNITHIVSRKEKQGQKQLQKTKKFFENELTRALNLDLTEKGKLSDFFRTIPTYVALPNVTSLAKTGDAELLLRPFFENGSSAETTLFKEPSDGGLYKKIYPWMLSMCYHLKTYKKDPSGIDVALTASLKENIVTTSALVEENSENLVDWYLRDQTQATPGVTSNGIYQSPEQSALLDPFYHSMMPKLLFITGDAGSGKTYILAEKMRQLLTEDAGNKCIFIGSHEGLVNKIRGMMEKSNASNKNWRCVTIDEFDEEVCTKLGFSEEDDYSNLIKVATLIQEKDAKICEVINNYSDYHLFTDEYQDTSDDQQVVIGGFMRANPNNKFRWTVFDDRQNWFGAKVGIPLCEEGKPFPLITLPAVHRLTPEVYKFVKSLQDPTEDNLPTSSGSLAMALPVTGKTDVEFYLLDYEELHGPMTDITGPSPPGDLYETVSEKLRAVYACCGGDGNGNSYLVEYLFNVHSVSELLFEEYLPHYPQSLRETSEILKEAKYNVGIGLGDMKEKLEDLYESVERDGEEDEHLMIHVIDSVRRVLGDFDEKRKRLRDLLESLNKDEEMDSDLVGKYAQLLVGGCTGTLENISEGISASVKSLIKDGKIDEQLKKLDCDGSSGFSLKQKKLSDLLCSLINDEGILREHIIVITDYYLEDEINAICKTYGVSGTNRASFKGLESPVVIVYSDTVLSSLGRNWCNFCVAASRATCKLYVVTPFYMYLKLTEQIRKQKGFSLQDAKPPGFDSKRKQKAAGNKHP